MMQQLGALCVIGLLWGLPIASPEDLAGLPSDQWHLQSGSVTYVSIGHSGVWGINKTVDNKIYYRIGTYGQNTETGSSWIQVDGSLVQLDVGDNIVWGVNDKHEVFFRTGIGATNPTGTAWQQVSGHMDQVSVSQDGYLWGVYRKIVYLRLGADNSNPGGSTWRPIYRDLVQVSVGWGGVWGVNDAKEIFYRNGTNGGRGNTDGTAWTQVPGGTTGGLKYVSSGANIVWGVNADNFVYYRSGITFDTPTGTSWVMVSGTTLEQVEASAVDRPVWGVIKFFGNPLHSVVARLP